MYTGATLLFCDCTSIYQFNNYNAAQETSDRTQGRRNTLFPIRLFQPAQGGEANNIIYFCNIPPDKGDKSESVFRHAGSNSPSFSAHTYNINIGIILPRRGYLKTTDDIIYCVFFGPGSSEKNAIYQPRSHAQITHENKPECS